MGGNCLLSLPCLGGLLKLQYLALDNCNLSDEAIAPTNLWSLPCLDYLDLSGNSFCSLPSLRGLPELADLILDNCTNLHAIPELPTNLAVLKADGCTALERMPSFSEMSRMQQLNLSDCPKLIDIPGLGKSSPMLLIQMGGCTNISETLKENILQRWSYGSNYGGIYLPGNDIPRWFMYVNEGGRVSFQVPPNIGGNLKALTVCIVYSCISISRNYLHYINVYIINHTKLTCFWVQPPTRPKDIISGGVIWQVRLSNRKLKIEGGDNVEVCVAIHDHFPVNKIGVDLVLDNSISVEGLDFESFPYSFFRRENDDEGEITSNKGFADDDDVASQQNNFNYRCGLWSLIAAICCWNSN
ncbi:hypothetical protein M0R45_026989 [Rubus argutus]